jgi:hypothetical protein
MRRIHMFIAFGVAATLFMAAPAASEGVATTLRPIPGRLDPACNAGHGIGMTLHSALINAVGFARLTSGVTLIGFDGTDWSYKLKAPYELHAVTTSCTIDHSFGTNGVEPVHIPALDAYTSPSIIPLTHSEFLLVGSTAHDVFLGRFNASGHLQKSFGTGGCLLLSPHGRPSGLESAAVSAAGVIYIAVQPASSAGQSETLLYAISPIRHYLVRKAYYV